MRLGLTLPLLAATLAAPLAAQAQPGAPLQGNPIDRVAPAAPPRVAPALEAPPIEARTGPGAARRLRVVGASVSGNEAIPTSALEPSLAPLRGQEVAVAQIEEARIGILAAYRRGGFPFAAVDAGVTPRRDGSVDVAFRVTEGYIAEVRLDGDIGPAGTQVLRFLEPLTRQRPVSAAALERALLLASDVPGVTVRGVVRPLPNEPGALQLVAQVERRAFGGYLNVDNRGSRFAGPWQALLSLQANSFTEYGERTELALFGSEGNTQRFGQVSVEGFAGGSGLRLRAWAGTGEAEPGSELAAIGYAGDTTVYGVAASYPIIRSRPLTLNVQGQFDGFDGEVRTGLGAASSVASKDSVRALRGGVDVQSLDELIPLLPAGVTTGNLRLHQGLSGLGATSNDDPLATRAGSTFDFSKLTFELQRNQPLFEPVEGWLVSLQGLMQGQYSNDVLPQVEKAFLGGARLNRGYYAGQVTGDSTFAWSIELQLGTRFELPGDLPYGLGSRVDTQFYAFYDQGRTFENAPFEQNRRLSSVGGGVRFNISDTVYFDIEGTHRRTRQPDGAGTETLDANEIYFRTMFRF